MSATLKAIFPGSFDPFTKGHIDIVIRAASIFDEVIVAILSHHDKNTLFTLEERLALIQEELRDLGPKASVKSFSGLLVEFAKEEGARVILRGLRAISDYDYEAQMALMNKHLYPDIETLFLISREEYSYVSSTMVKQVARLGGSISTLVSPHIEKALKQKLGVG